MIDQDQIITICDDLGACITVDPTGLVRVDGIPVFLARVTQAGVILQFKERVNKNQRRLVEVPLPALIERIISGVS